MSRANEVRKLATYIEENLRASRNAGLSFVDPRELSSSLHSKQSHLIFGRRGAGKSTFVASLAANTADQITVSVNLEDYKDISFPNIVVHVLREIFTQIASALQKKYNFFHFQQRKIAKELRQLVHELSQLLDSPDLQSLTVRQKESTTDSTTAGVSTKLGKLATGQQSDAEKEVHRTDSYDKLGRLKIEIYRYKQYFERVSRGTSNQPVFLVLDDFYFIPKDIQPQFIDFFHRVAKGTGLFLKIATIRHRTKHYLQADGSYIGVELGHDIYEIDMDYTLDNFEDLKRFMRQLLEGAIKDSQCNISLDDIFAGDGFAQLCLASGGVPRDFLSLFVRAANKNIISDSDKIGKVDINHEAIAAINSKLDSLKVDSAQERETLELYLAAVKSWVYGEKRTNIFLVAKPDLESHPQERQALKELVDLRLIHLVDSNTSSAPSDGRRYEAYMLDVGLYDNSRPRNFVQIEPGIQDEKSRRDAIRAAPRVDLAQLRARVAKDGKVTPLAVTV